MSSNFFEVPFAKPSISVEEENAVLNVMRSGWLTTAKVALAFEKDFSTFVNDNTKSPVISLAVNSNTSGMILALKASGVKQGSVVITTPYTFNSTPAAAVLLGAKVVFVDIEKDSYNIDPLLIQQQLEINPLTSAIIPVHIAGNVCNMNAINAIAKSHKSKVYVIEDCAHSFPSYTANGYAGTLGDFGVFSFYANKVITTAEGGMITTRDKKAAEYIKVLRLHGMSRSLWDRYTDTHASWEYDIVDLGYKFNLPDILCAIGIEQLKKANIFLDKRKRIARLYNEAFTNCNVLILPPDLQGNAWLLYMIRLRLNMLKVDRDTFAKALQEQGIGVSIHFIPSFRMTYWKKLYPNLKEKDFPNALNMYQTSISIPIWPDMTDSMIERVIEVVLQVANKYSK